MTSTAASASSADSSPALLSTKTTAAADLPSVPLLDVGRIDPALKERIRAAIDRVCQSGAFILGPDVTRLEESVSQYCQTSHAVGCSSGSDSLLLALVACGIEAGDEVIMPSYTFFATAGAVWRIGAKPVFVDIDPVSYNLDPALVEPAITPATKAIIPVHLYGQCAEMDPINEIAQRHGLSVIEDACQAIGAEYQGRRAGSLGDAGCFSFYPTKNLGAMGDAGMVTSASNELAERLRLLRVHGMAPRYHHKIVGVNARIDSIQAAVLNEKLPHLDAWTAMRCENAERYARLFAECGLDSQFGLPGELPERRHAWNQYIVRVPDGRRDALRTYLAEKQVGSEIYYPVPLHQQECFASLGYETGCLPETERAAAETIALPIFPGLTASSSTPWSAASLNSGVLRRQVCRRQKCKLMRPSESPAAATSSSPLRRSSRRGLSA